MKNENSDFIRFSISLPASLLKEFDKFIEEKGFPNRSEAIRHLMREALSQHIWEDESGIIFGSLTIVYDHHMYDVTQKLTALEHNFTHIIISTMHIHVDHHNCLQVTVLKGNSKQLKEYITALTSLRGIKHAKFVITTVIE